MALTEMNVQELNNMNEAARRANLGTVLQDLVGVVATASAKNSTNIKKVAHQDNSTATDVAGIVNDFNALLTKLKAAGIMA